MKRDEYTQRIIDKLQRLMRLRQSSNVHEAALAARYAQEIADKYHLQHYLEEPEVEEEIIKRLLALNFEPWMGKLGLVLGKANQCHVYSVERLDRLVEDLYVAGTEYDVHVVHYLFAYTVAEIKRLLGRDGLNEDERWALSYRLGAIKEIEKELESTNTRFAGYSKGTTVMGNGWSLYVPEESGALVRFDSRIDRVIASLEDLNLEDKDKMMVKINAEAYSAGRKAGKEIELRTNARLEGPT